MPRHLRVSCGYHFLRRESEDGKARDYKVNKCKMTYIASNVSKSKTQSSEQKPF